MAKMSKIMQMVKRIKTKTVKRLKTLAVRVTPWMITLLSMSCKKN